jgi:squamous cell carcinoma antigen recognized by T-cells 3
MGLIQTFGLVHSAHNRSPHYLMQTLFASSPTKNLTSHRRNRKGARAEAAAAMVLRRNKLKQKLHTLLPADEAEAENLGEEAQSLKERLLSSKRPRPKRPPKKKLTLEEEKALRLQAEAEWRKEVELGREERRKEKKEKRRIRRLKEAEAAAAAREGTQQVEGEAEAVDKEDPQEFADPAVAAEDR